VELTIDKRIQDHFTLKYGVLGINTKSISNNTQYVTLDSNIKCLSLAVSFLAIPPIRLKLELHVRGELLIANHLVIDQSEILSRSQVQFITLSLGGAQLCFAIYRALQAARIWGRKTNFQS
jgi:hypothetical protein